MHNYNWKNMLLMTLPISMPIIAFSSVSLLLLLEVMISRAFWSDTKCIDASNFISVNASISHGISATSQIQVDQLYDLLISKKDDINDILKLQPIYAIGPNFQENFSLPCITCWTTKLLDKSILKRLKILFDNKYIVNQVVVTPVDTNTSELSSGSSSNYYGNADNTESNDNRERSKRRLARDEKDLKGKKNDSFGNDNDGSNDSDDDNSNDDGNNNRKVSDFVTVTSGVIAKIENSSQSFDITARIQAKVIIDEENTKLNFYVDVCECSMQDMISKKCLAIKKEGYGYFLDSVEVSVSPIIHGFNDSILSLDRSPRKEKQFIERSIGRETTFGITGKFGTTNGVEFGGGSKDIRGIKLTSEEWKLTDNFSHKTGCCWLYNSDFGNSNDYNLSFNRRIHSGEWYIYGEAGFRITITQVLRFKIK